jgi:hypothetical protein
VIQTVEFLFICEGEHISAWKDKSKLKVRKEKNVIALHQGEKYFKLTANF